MTIEFRYARRTMWRWQQYAATGSAFSFGIGMPKEKALAIAKANHDTYDANWLQASADGGQTWVDVPPAREIPQVDEREIHTGRIWGG